MHLGFSQKMPIYLLKLAFFRLPYRLYRKYRLYLHGARCCLRSGPRAT